MQISRLTLDMRFMMPHCTAADRASNRVVITGHEMSRVLISEPDPDTDELTTDNDFREKGATEPGIEHIEWPFLVFFFILSGVNIDLYNVGDAVVLTIPPGFV